MGARQHEGAVREEVLQLGDAASGQVDVVEEHGGAHRAQEVPQLLAGGPRGRVGEESTVNSAWRRSSSDCPRAERHTTEP